MPPRLVGAQGNLPQSIYVDGNAVKDLGYAYPRGLDLRPGSKKHEELRKEIWDRAWDARRIMSLKFDEWREMDRVLKVYKTPDRMNNDRADSSRKPDPLDNLIMPVTFANLETLQTYMSAAFLNDPIFTYEGAGPEDVAGGLLMTQLIAHQSHKARVGLNLGTQWRDAFAYGFGVVHPYWDKEFGTIVDFEETGWEDDMNGIFYVTERKRKVRKGITWEGNRLANIDPYRYFPDPSVGVHEPERAEYVGWLDEESYIGLLSMERQKGSDLFNVKYLKDLRSGKSAMASFDDSNRDEHKTSRSSVSTNQPIDLIMMYIDLIPSDWGLGKKQYPETWFFCLAADQVIIDARPFTAYHGQKPVAVTAPDTDGYSPFPTSRLQTTLDLQHLVDFLHRSHIANIRKSINNMLVVDPSIINIGDVNNPAPGKVIRTRRSAWGRGGIDSAIKQLAVQDITAGHIGDSQYITNFMEEVLGTSQGLKGQVVRSGERVSATETRDARTSGLARLERIARVISMQSNLNIARQFAYNTQQYMSKETYVKVAGEWPERLQSNFGLDVDDGRVLVDPEQLAFEFDIIERDGTIPGSENANTWIQVLQVVAQNQEMVQAVNMPKLITHIARHLGAKNPEDFINQAAQGAPPQVMQDEQVMQQVQAGNLVDAGYA